MEESRLLGFDRRTTVSRKRRSSYSRRPLPDTCGLRNATCQPLSSKPSPNNLSKFAPEAEELSPNKQVPRYGISVNSGYPVQELMGTNLKPCSAGVLALPVPTRCISKSNKVKLKLDTKLRNQGVSLEKSSDGHSTHAVNAPNVLAEEKLHKVKLMLGGLTQTILPKSVRSGNACSSIRAINSSDFYDYQQQPPYQEILGEDTDLPKFSSEAEENSLGQVIEENVAVLLGSVRESKMSKTLVPHATFDNHENCYKVCPKGFRSSKLATNHTHGIGDDKENRTMRNTAYKGDKENMLPMNKIKKMPSYTRECNDTYYSEKEQIGGCSYDESRRKKHKKVLVDMINSIRAELSTSGHHPLQSGRDVQFSSATEFPNGHPPLLLRKQQHGDKPEAAQKCKMRKENAAKETEERTTRKTVRVDTDKEKTIKQRTGTDTTESASLRSISSCTVRLESGPNGTFVTFPEAVGLPCIFVSKPCSYPVPQDVSSGPGGPACTSSYRCRDSMSNMSCCTQQCCRSVHGSDPPKTIW